MYAKGTLKAEVAAQVVRARVVGGRVLGVWKILRCGCRGCIGGYLAQLARIGALNWFGGCRSIRRDAIWQIEQVSSAGGSDLLRGE